MGWDYLFVRQLFRSQIQSFQLFKEMLILSLAVGSIPYSSLAPPTTDERVADSISIATAGFKENFLRVVFPLNLDILINIHFIKVSSRP